MGNKKPTHEIKLGRIRATIWANVSVDDELWFNVTVTRIYKSGTTWKDSSTLRRDDLPIAMKALDMAHSWIWRAQLKKERNDLQGNGQAAHESGGQT